ncbi:MAG: ABC transporter ATP-binding protein [Anaerolineales bacterium]|nr:MAG: ABC transporter ATP-binding protein [Anaerolineales bacterium]
MNVISVEHLSKSYRLGQINTGTFSRDLEAWWARLRGRPNPHLRIGETDPLLTAKSAKSAKEELNPGGLSGLRGSNGEEDDIVWALRDVSFTVEQGEVLGIIGRNGAGKSTLLKILSRVTAPTSGVVKVKGRVASLLEVGTGFHPELTGRENTYLNGAILGMSRREIDRKFDEIVDFAGVEKYIDTPVKRYSSGMYVRLAFAVAAHLDPEILVVDEVLAVGDAEFQKKCLGKMGEVAQGGRTVLFVSHSMSAIVRLCNRAILLQQGALVADGRSIEVSRYYLTLDSISTARKIWPETIAPGNSIAKLKSVQVLDVSGNISETTEITNDIFIEIEYWNFSSHLRSTVIVHIVNEDGITLFASNDWNDTKWLNTPRKKGIVRSRCRIPGNFLAEGRFFVLVAIGTYNPNVIHAIERDVVSFQVVDRTEGGSSRGEYAGNKWPGVVRPLLDWTADFI